jgi:hypothetical protein
MKYCTILLLLLFYFSANAQKMKDKYPDQRITALEDRAALKELVDVFSNLADSKETEKQALLFTEDAVSETYVAGNVVSSLKGRKEIAKTFASFLNNFETVYHINGQQTVTLNGDKATGTSYCIVTLIGTEKGKKMKTTIGAFYQDDYVKGNGKWLISHRKATFAWQEKHEIP